MFIFEKNPKNLQKPVEIRRNDGTISVISSHSEEPVANFNIANLNKSAEDFSPVKKACPDLNL